LIAKGAFPNRIKPQIYPDPGSDIGEVFIPDSIDGRVPYFHVIIVVYILLFDKCFFTKNSGGFSTRFPHRPARLPLRILIWAGNLKSHAGGHDFLPF
jgi:hypothetical protein